MPTLDAISALFQPYGIRIDNNNVTIPRDESQAYEAVSRFLAEGLDPTRPERYPQGTIQHLQLQAINKIYEQFPQFKGTVQPQPQPNFGIWLAANGRADEVPQWAIQWAQRHFPKAPAQYQQAVANNAIGVAHYYNTTTDQGPFPSSQPATPATGGTNPDGTPRIVTPHWWETNAPTFQQIAAGGFAQTSPVGAGTASPTPAGAPPAGSVTPAYGVTPDWMTHPPGETQDRRSDLLGGTTGDRIGTAPLGVAPLASLPGSNIISAGQNRFGTQPAQTTDLPPGWSPLPPSQSIPAIGRIGDQLNGQPVSVAQGTTSPGAGGAVPAAGTTGAAGPAGSSPDQQSAMDRLRFTLDAYGLGSLADWAWSKIQSGESEAGVLFDLRQTPEYKTRFPGMEARRKAGLPAISEGDYINYETTLRQLFRAQGLPGGFYDQPQDFVTYLSGDVSPSEINDRVGLYRQVADEVAADPANANVLAELDRQYGITPESGEFLAYVMDPGKALPVIAKQVQAAQLGTASLRTGYGRLARGEAESLAAMGVSEAQAQQGFNTLASQTELFGTLPGQTGSTVSREQQLGAAFRGDAAAQQQIERTARQRVGAFGGGGDLARNREGIAGLGTASR